MKEVFGVFLNENESEVEGQLYDIIPRNENSKHDRIIGNVLKYMN